MKYINNNKERIEQNKDYYRKRQWGFNYIMTKKTIKRAEADVGFIFIVYNLRRILNIIGIEALRSYLLALFIKISLLLRQFQAFWGTQKLYLLKVFQNLTAPILTKNTNFTKQFCCKTNLVGSF
jgi:hypothetical protein